MTNPEIQPGRSTAIRQTEVDISKRSGTYHLHVKSAEVADLGTFQPAHDRAQSALTRGVVVGAIYKAAEYVSYGAAAKNLISGALHRSPSELARGVGFGFASFAFRETSRSGRTFADEALDTDVAIHDAFRSGSNVGRTGGKKTRNPFWRRI